MNYKLVLLLVPAFLCLFVVWCWKDGWEKEEKNNDLVFQYCEDNWGFLEFSELPDWNVLWTCFFSDGSFCDIRDYRDWSCKPWDNAVWINKIIIKCVGVECS